MHIGAVSLSFTGFVARGIGVMRRQAWVRRPITRVLPHVMDTILLLSALGMLWVLRLSPWALPWLRAKLVGLVCYVLLGTVALRSHFGRAPSPPQGVRLGSGLAALLVLGYIVSVALTKNPRGLLVLLH